MTEPEVADVHTIEVDSAAAPAPGACMNDAAHFIEPVPPLVEKPMPPELARWTSLTYVDGAGTVCTTMASDGAKIEHFPGTRRTDPETGFAEPDPTIEEEAPPPTPAAAERRETEAVRQVMPASLSPATTAAATEQQPKPPPSLQAPRPRSRKPSKTTIPLDEKDQALCLGIQDKELRFLVRLYKAGRQERGEPFVSQADMIQQWGINRDILYETDELGRMIGYTPEKDEFIGHNALGRGATTYKRKGQFVTIPPEQFLKRVTPGSETPAQTKARRAKSKRQYRSERERQRTSRSRAATKARRRRVADLDCRASALREVLIPGKWMTVKRVAPYLEKSPAFDGLTGESLHRAIERELAKEPLSNMIQQKKKATARLGFSTKMFRLK